MSPRQKETLLIGLSYLEAHHEGNDEFIKLIKTTVDKDELIHSLTMLNIMISNLAISGLGESESCGELLRKTRTIIETR